MSQIVRILLHQMIESQDGARTRDNIVLFQEIRVTTYFPHGLCTCWSQSRTFCESSQRTLLDCKHVLDNRQETVWRILLTVADDKIQLPVRTLMYSFQNKSLGHHRESRFPVLVWATQSKKCNSDLGKTIWESGTGSHGGTGPVPKFRWQFPVLVVFPN